MKIVIGISGSSGSIYAKLLLDKILLHKNQFEEVAVVITENGKANWNLEIGNDSYAKYPFQFYEKNDFNAPFASGSARFNAMVLCPCSAGMMARVANGISNDLLTRAADVVLKERRKLILVLRETPLSLIHINNMKAITESGGIILPATPSFYSQPKSIESLCMTVVDRIFDLLQIEHKTYRWHEEN